MNLCRAVGIGSKFYVIWLQFELKNNAIIKPFIAMNRSQNFLNVQLYLALFSKCYQQPLTKKGFMPKKQVIMTRKYHNQTLQTNPWHREEEPQNNKSHRTPGRQSKATSSLFLIKMTAKLVRKQSNAQQYMEQTQNPTMGATINNESTTTEPLP